MDNLQVQFKYDKDKLNKIKLKYSIFSNTQLIKKLLDDSLIDSKSEVIVNSNVSVDYEKISSIFKKEILVYSKAILDKQVEISKEVIKLMKGLDK
jgi:hypothetical protein